jgi:hypothetical protein
LVPAPTHGTTCGTKRGISEWITAPGEVRIMLSLLAEGMVYVERLSSKLATWAQLSQRLDW